MGTSQRRRDRGLEHVGRTLRQLSQEIRNARRAAGLSIATAARSVGMSASTFGRLERGEAPNATYRQGALACAAVGLEAATRAYPAASPVRDRAHLALLGRLRQLLPAGAGWLTEVPLPTTDYRAWDCRIHFGALRIHIEAETRLRDIQALCRRVALKMRDGGVDIVILLISDTAANRRALREHREELRALFPLDTRAVLADLRAGRVPTASGIAVL